MELLIWLTSGLIGILFAIGLNLRPVDEVMAFAGAV